MARKQTPARIAKTLTPAMVKLLGDRTIDRADHRATYAALVARGLYGDAARLTYGDRTRNDLGDAVLALIAA